MTYPVPERLVPTWRATHLRTLGEAVFALLALIAFVLALFEVTVGQIDLVVLGFCFLAAHHLFEVALPWNRRPA